MAMIETGGMDDFGNDYMTDEWFCNNEGYMTSVNTFGLFDDVALEIAIVAELDVSAQDI